MSSIPIPPLSPRSSPRPTPARVKRRGADPAAPPPRRAYLGPDGGREAGWAEPPILRRSDLAAPRVGPLIVEEYDAPCVVPPGATASLDPAGNIVIALA